MEDFFGISAGHTYTLNNSFSSQIDLQENEEDFSDTSPLVQGTAAVQYEYEDQESHSTNRGVATNTF